MKPEEAKKMFCPINSHPASDGMCNADKCMLWVNFNKDGDGDCAEKLEVEGLMRSRSN